MLRSAEDSGKPCQAVGSGRGECSTAEARRNAVCKVKGQEHEPAAGRPGGLRTRASRDLRLTEEVGTEASWVVCSRSWSRGGRLEVEEWRSGGVEGWWLSRQVEVA